MATQPLFIPVGSRSAHSSLDGLAELIKRLDWRHPLLAGLLAAHCISMALATERINELGMRGIPTLGIPRVWGVQRDGLLTAAVYAGPLLLNACGALTMLLGHMLGELIRLKQIRRARR
ncbi:hypothetical protein THASP1DRAFT_24835 [Thamnocephalis sphaerospora]|uniref:Uncharacterized protein n=1 Tax=Thamnocephalis sphaerospora TaxID=78915 RepID=A0A4P9XM59_9FUNG|nr:hypothetical protein THASP1DRAFT_24835 [Thamnocephalis sphaerospora]|eukprot:RKP06926.1 hypothetical protein THASP1DRAFT_24835 [Thamnocephalis sphaerospora]